MRGVHTSAACHLAGVAFVLLACLGAAQGVRADEPMLAIRLVGGESAIYPVAIVQRIAFEADTLIMVKSDGTERYAATSISRIEFLLQSAGVTTPRDAEALVHAMRLFQNQPNPFSPETRIAFDLPQAGKAELTIYRPDGRLVRRLVNGERPAGRQEVCWDGLDDAGRRVAGGVYFCRLRAVGVVDTRQMILLL